MGVFRKVKRAIRGDVAPRIAVLEAARRASVYLTRLHEGTKPNGDQPRFQSKFAQMTPAELVSHYRNRRSPQLFPNFTPSFAETHRQHFQTETLRLLESAQRIVDEHSWSLLGFGVKPFGKEINWLRDPVTNYRWPLDYYLHIKLMRSDGSDVRVLWELNRLGHLLTLARAYVLTKDEQMTHEFLAEVNSWITQNPLGRGPNWACAMEVALRAINLLGAFDIFRKSPQLDEGSLSVLLTCLYQHGVFIKRNLEFSYIATSNHYLSDVVGLLWLGILLPELHSAEEWREFGFREMLREVDKQVLDDGADFESSTGYHRFVLELFLYSFLLCQTNGFAIGDHYRRKLQAMLTYLQSYLRSDGYAPLIGDTDGGQVLPITKHAAHDHAYLLPIGSVVLDSPTLKLDQSSPSEELLWLLGEQGCVTYESMPSQGKQSSKDFPSAGTYIMRHDSLYLCFNASGAGIDGRGSHGHDDALSIEVSVAGRAFIVDPGTYVYSADLKRRHQFRSTAYHSTVQIDDEEQNTTLEDMPFVIGDEAHPEVLFWETTANFDKISAEHRGYARLARPIVHRRTVTLSKKDCWWLVEDEFSGEGEHEFKIRFHFDAGLEVTTEGCSAIATDNATGLKLSITPLTLVSSPSFEAQYISRDYGDLQSSITAYWHVSGKPQKLAWRIIPHMTSGVGTESA